MHDDLDDRSSSPWLVPSYWNFGFLVHGRLQEFTVADKNIWRQVRIRATWPYLSKMLLAGVISTVLAYILIVNISAYSSSQWKNCEGFCVAIIFVSVLAQWITFEFCGLFKRLHLVSFVSCCFLLAVPHQQSERSVYLALSRGDSFIDVGCLVVIFCFRLAVPRKWRGRGVSSKRDTGHHATLRKLLRLEVVVRQSPPNSRVTHCGVQAKARPRDRNLSQAAEDQFLFAPRLEMLIFQFVTWYLCKITETNAILLLFYVTLCFGRLFFYVTLCVQCLGKSAV